MLLSFFFIFKKVRKHPIIMLFYLYLSSSFISIFLDVKYLKVFGWHPEDYTIWGYLLFASCNIVCLLPILKLKDYSPLIQKFTISKSIQYFFLFWFVLALFSLIYHLPYATKALKTNVEDIRYILNTEKKSVLPETSLTTIAVAVAAFYNVFIFLFFSILTQKPRYFKILVFTIVSSITYVLSSLTFGARDGLLFYILSTSFAFLLHKNAIPEKLRKRALKFLIVFGLTFVLLLARFTHQRFIENRKFTLETALQVGVLGYFGQQPHVFNEAIWQHNKTKKFHGHSLRFPLLNHILGEQKLPNRKVAVEWSFGSFLKDFYDISGLSSLIPLVLTFSCYFYYHFGRWQYYHPLRNIVLISFYWQFLLSGLFFFNLGSFAGNVTILIYLLTFWGLKFIYPNRKFN